MKTYKESLTRKILIFYQLCSAVGIVASAWLGEEVFYCSIFLLIVFYLIDSGLNLILNRK